MNEEFQRFLNTSVDSKLDFIQWTNHLIQLCASQRIRVELTPTGCWVSELATGVSTEWRCGNPLSTSQFRSVLARLIAICRDQTCKKSGVYDADCTLMIDNVVPQFMQFCVANTLQQQFAKLHPGLLNYRESINRLTERLFESIQSTNTKAPEMAAFIRSYSSEFKDLLKAALPGVDPCVALLTESPDPLRFEPASGFDDLSEIDAGGTFLKLLHDELGPGEHSIDEIPFQLQLKDSESLVWASKERITIILVMPIQPDFNRSLDTVGFLVLLTRQVCSTEVVAALKAMLSEFGEAIQKAIEAIHAREHLHFK